MSVSPAGGRSATQNNDTTPQPPWEQRSIGQVPYMSPAAPPLTQAERHALPSLWASRDNGSTECSKPSTYGHDHGYPGYGHPTPPEEAMNAWRVKTPLTAPLFTAPPPPIPPIPYESVRIPQAPKSAPNLPTFVKAPPSPPDSFNLSRSSTKSSSTKSGRYESPPPRQPSVIALAGTMSTGERERATSRSRTPLSERDRHTRKEEAQPLPFGKRFKLRMKDLFRRDPVDETAFERIEDRHWTEDY